MIQIGWCPVAGKPASLPRLQRLSCGAGLVPLEQRAHCSLAFTSRRSSFFSGDHFHPFRSTGIDIDRGSSSSTGGSWIVHGGGGGMGSGRKHEGEPIDTWQKALLVGIGVAYLMLIVILPFLNVFVQAFQNGFGPFISNVTDPDFLHAVKLTLTLAAICVPINTIFGIRCAMILAKEDFWGRPFVISLLDLPFSISPVVVGLMLVLLYGRDGLFAPLLEKFGFNVVFAFPGMAFATLFVTLPFVARELLPILEQQDPAEEEVARTLGANEWQVFWNVTLPNIRFGLLYGIILTNARAMGEFGAVSVISGNIIGQTQTLTLFVESAYKEYNTEAAFSASVLLCFLALLTLIAKSWVEDQARQEM